MRASAYGSTVVLVENLMGVAEVARYFSVGKTTVSQWAARRDTNGMPPPVITLDCGTIYDISDLIPWWRQWTPARGKRAGTLPGTPEVTG